MRYKKIAMFLLVGEIFLTGCGTGNDFTGEGQTDIAETVTEEGSDDGSNENSDGMSNEIDTSDMFTDQDKEIGYDEESSAVIKLSDDKSSCDSDAVQIVGNTITIVDEGTYILSGMLTNGMIIVDAEDSDKVQFD